MNSTYDLVIIGGGPAGLSVAVNAASERIRTLLLNGEPQLGGQAGTSSFIENYAGFPCGVTGRELTDRMVTQAQRFGTDMLAPVTAGRLSRDPETGLLLITDDAGDCFGARSVAIATGVQYRRIPLMNVVSYLGRGIAYGSPQLQDSYTDKVLFVIGGANSAGQAAVHLAKCTGCTVHVVVRGGSLDLKMSHYLIQRIEDTPNIVVHTKSEVTQVDGNGKLQTVVLTSPEGDKTMNVDNMFVMIGALPKTTWLDGTVDLDRGYILAGRDLTEDARDMFQTECGRSPFDSETSVPGVFVAGDVRANAVRRVGAAVGSGSSVVPDIHRHLAKMP